MTTEDPAAAGPDDEHLSRFLDADLDIEEAAALADRLRDDPVLRGRLQQFAQVGELVRDVPPADPAAAEAMLGAALAAFDETFHVEHASGSPGDAMTTPAAPAAAHDAATPSDPPAVLPLERARARRSRRSANLLGLSAAAALILLVAVAAVAARFGSTGGSAGDAAVAESASPSFTQQRVDAATKSGAAAAADAGPADSGGAAAGNAAEAATVAPLSSAAGAPTTTAIPPVTTVTLPAATVPTFASVDELVAAVRSGVLRAPGTPPASVAPSSCAGAPSSVAATGATATATATAIVDGRTVRWSVGSDGPGERIVVLDAVTCEVLADQPR